MRNFERSLTSFLFFVLASFALYKSVYIPYENWDMITYIAAAKSFEEQDIDLLHSFAYKQLRLSVSTTQYKALINGKFRHMVATNPSVLKKLLPFYQIRPVYTGLVYFLYKTGVDIGFATHIISGISVVISIIFLYFLSVSFLPKPYLYAVLLLAILFGVDNLAQYSSPDGLAFLAMVLAAYLYQKQRTSLLLIFLPVIIGIRTDLMIFTIPLLIFILFFEKNCRWKAVLSLFISVVIYISIGKFWGNPGWATIFNYTFVHMTPNLSTLSFVTPEQYFKVLFKASKHLMINNQFILYFIITAYSLYIFNIRAKKTSLITAINSPEMILSIVCIIYVSAHFLVFPVAWERFFSAPYLIGSIASLALISEEVNTRRKDNKNLKNKQPD